MWDLSSLAQKAKEAVANFESEINDSVGYVDAGGISNLFHDTDAKKADENNEADYFQVEEEEVSFTEADQSLLDDKRGIKSSTDGDNGTKDVDESGGWDQCEDASVKDNSSSTLPKALAQIEALEKEIKLLKEELVAAREETKSYRVTNLELEQQVRDLTEENMSLKMNMAT
jgi:hypothetical protein